MSIDELSVMDGSKCILQLRGVRPFLSDKYDITRHKNYRYLSDANSKNTFNIGRHVKRRLRLRPDDEVELFEYAEADENVPNEAMDDFQTTADAESIDESDIDDTEFEIDLEPV